MWLLAERFVSEFTERFAFGGWEVDLVEDDEFVIFVKSINSEVEAEVGLDLTRRPFGLSLNPSLSVRNKSISQLTAQFFGFDRGAAFVGVTLSDLLRSTGRGSGAMWTIEDEEEVPRVVLDVLSDIETYGGPFFVQYASTRDLIRHLEAVAATNLEYALLAVAYAATEEELKIYLMLSRLEEIAAQRPSLLADQTRSFISAFRSHFNFSVE